MWTIHIGSQLVDVRKTNTEGEDHRLHPIRKHAYVFQYKVEVQERIHREDDMTIVFLREYSIARYCGKEYHDCQSGAAAAQWGLITADDHQITRLAPYATQTSLYSNTFFLPKKEADLKRWSDARDLSKKSFCTQS